MNNVGTAIVLKGVNKGYTKGDALVEVLRSVELFIAPGESIAIMGASGVGKSTLLNVIGGLDRPTAGEVKIGGKDIWQMPDRQLANFRNFQMGFVFQFHHLLKDFDATENVAMPLMVRGASKEESTVQARIWLNRVGLGDRMNHRPGELSGGEQQRVAIARAMVTDPPIILADEPTGNLDNVTSEQIHGLVLDLNKERRSTLVVVTHNMALAKQADRIVWLYEGKIFQHNPLS